MKKIIFLLMTVLAFAASTFIQAQQVQQQQQVQQTQQQQVQQELQKIVVQGKVTDETGAVVVGATVKSKTGSNAAITDINGNYSIQTTGNDVLIFSVLGKETIEQAVAGRINIDIALEAAEQSLEQVVVVGYQSQKKNDISGSLSVVSGNELVKTPVPSVELALQGRAAGVQVSTQTGAPGSPVSVRIRGVSSVSSSNDPLYIIDGVPVESGLSNISPSDIESISILKDAASAAIYGSRANNGVVLVTTKNGTEGDPKVTYNTQLGVQIHGPLIPIVNTADYIKLYNEATRADNASSVVQRPLIEGEYIKDFADVNWLEEIFRPAFIQSHDLSVSGGTKKVNYYVGASYYDQQGIVLNTNYNRFSFRGNVRADVKKWLQVGLNMQAASSFNRRVSSSGDGLASKASGNVSEGGSIVRYALFSNPARRIYNQDGSFADLPSDYYGNNVYNSFFGDSYNPVGLAKMTDMTDRLNALIASGNVTFKLPKNISIRGLVGMDYNDTRTRNFNNVWGSANRIGAITSMNEGDSKDNTVTANLTLNQDITIKEKHGINWMLGTELLNNHGWSISGSDGDLGDIHYLGYGLNDDGASSGEWDARLLSFFGAFNYNYDRKYYISALVREDGSSRFSPGNRWGTFYSVSASWNMENEAFMQTQKVINKFKWRIGYGSVGNQNIALYANVGRYTGGRYYPFGGLIYDGYAMSALGNRNLKWETSNQLNAGVDVEFFKGAFGFSIDYYYKITKDMLVESVLPPSVGYVGSPWINNGSVLNTGVDLEIFYRKNFNRGGFSASLNGGYLYNEVLSINAPLQSGMVDGGIYATRTVVGQPIGAFYLLEVEGIFQSRREILTSALPLGQNSANIQPGDIKYKDNYKDGVIDEKDRVYCGSAIPKFTMGLNLSVNYYGFDLSLFFQGAFGQKIYTQVFHDLEGFYRGFPVTQRYYDEHWTAENPSTTQPRASWTAKSNNARAGTTRFLEDGSYVRLKNIQLGYTIPNTQKVGIENLRVYFAATNVWTITGYSGLDPEMTVSTNSQAEGDRSNGIDWGTYPVAMSFTFGVNFTF